jgi:hypothetical protein
MSIIAIELVGGEIDFPTPKCRFSIEHNVGDFDPIHIHFGHAVNQWCIRFAFKKGEFHDFVHQLKKAGEF